MRRPSLSTAIIFLVIAVMFTAVNARSAFPDPDSFYHAKMALMIRDHGFIHAFPWLQETIMRDAFVDSHLLYHVLLIPFVTLVDPLVGMKVSAVVFGMFAFYALYRSLRAVNSPYPQWLTLAAAFSFDFLHRMTLPRAPSLSVAILLLGILAMLRRKTWAVFGIAVAFAWFYHGWPVIVAAYGCVAVGSLLVGHWKKEIPAFPVWKTGLAVLAGVVVGNVANPYFPDNISMIVPVIVNVGVRETSSIPVGAEWSSPGWLMLFWNLPAIQAFLVATACLFLARKRHQMSASAPAVRTAVSLTLLMAFFWVFASRSIRYTEYLIPFVILAAGSVLAVARPFIEASEASVRREFSGLLSRFAHGPTARKSAVALVAVLCVLVTIRGINYCVSKDARFSEANYRGSADWLRENVEPGAIVFNALWDSSMIYFYLDDTHNYLVGLDPRLMYDLSADRYRLWEGLQTGRDPDVEKIARDFRASAVLIDRRAGVAFSANLDASPAFEKGYEDEWAAVYVLREPAR